MLRKLVLFPLVLILFTGMALPFRGMRWVAVKSLIRIEYPHVPRVKTGELAAQLHDSSRPPPILLDVRPRAEFAVSHLAGARQVDPKADPRSLGLPQDRPIVTYCSVGARSSAFAARLQQAGYPHVSNLEGSLFQWANEGRPMESEGHPVTVVHPFNAVWGSLLRKECRAPLAGRP